MIFPWNLSNLPYSKTATIINPEVVRINPSFDLNIERLSNEQSILGGLSQNSVANYKTQLNQNKIKVNLIKSFGIPLDTQTNIAVLNNLDLEYINNNTFKTLRNSAPTVRVDGLNGYKTISFSTEVFNSYLLDSWISGKLPYLLDSNLKTKINSANNPTNGSITILDYPNFCPYDQAISILSTKENGTGSAIKNNSHWGTNYLYSGVSTWSSVYNNRWRFSAISKRHVISANHVNGPIPNGTVIMFCGNNGEIISRTTTRSVQILSSDILITTLNSDLPDSVYIFGFMPTDWVSKLIPTIIAPYNFEIPALFISQDDYLCPIKWNVDMRWERYFPTDGKIGNYSMNIRYGDSGCPIFAMGPDNELLLLSIAHYGDSGESVNSILWRQTIIDELALAGKSLKLPDLSSYYI